jgi:hypothetical protein
LKAARSTLVSRLIISPPHLSDVADRIPAGLLLESLEVSFRQELPCDVRWIGEDPSHLHPALVHAEPQPVSRADPQSSAHSCWKGDLELSAHGGSHPITSQDGITKESIAKKD